MESLFGAQWESCNGLKIKAMDDWGGQWRCQMCEKDPGGMDQVMAHVQSKEHMKCLTARMAGCRMRE
eukprot:267900-Prorocentrum_lima.AAC.1